MISSSGKMLEIIFSTHWHYSIRTTSGEKFFGVPHVLKILKDHFMWRDWVSPESAVDLV